MCTYICNVACSITKQSNNVYRWFALSNICFFAVKMQMHWTALFHKTVNELLGYIIWLQALTFFGRYAFFNPQDGCPERYTAYWLELLNVVNALFVFHHLFVLGFSNTLLQHCLRTHQAAQLFIRHFFPCFRYQFSLRYPALVVMNGANVRRWLMLREIGCYYGVRLGSLGPLDCRIDSSGVADWLSAQAADSAGFTGGRGVLCLKEGLEEVRSEFEFFFFFVQIADQEGSSGGLKSRGQTYLISPNSLLIFDAIHITCISNMAGIKSIWCTFSILWCKIPNPRGLIVADISMLQKLRDSTYQHVAELIRRSFSPFLRAVLRDENRL